MDKSRLQSLVAFLSFDVCLCVFGLVGNAVLLVAVVRYKHSTPSVNPAAYFTAYNAVANLFACTALAATVVLTTLGQQHLCAPMGMCVQLYRCVVHVNVFLAAYTQFQVSVRRAPRRAKQSHLEQAETGRYSERRVMLYAVGMWLAATAYAAVELGRRGWGGSGCDKGGVWWLLKDGVDGVVQTALVGGDAFLLFWTYKQLLVHDRRMVERLREDGSRPPSLVADYAVWRAERVLRRNRHWTYSLGVFAFSAACSTALALADLALRFDAAAAPTLSLLALHLLFARPAFDAIGVHFVNATIRPFCPLLSPPLGATTCGAGRRAHHHVHVHTPECKLDSVTI